LTSIYRGSGGSSSIYSRNSAPAVKAKPQGHHGVLGFVENLGGDIGSTLLSLPAGLVHTVEHPVAAAHSIAKTYKDTYGPLVHGDVSKFLHGLYNHPLGPLLDLGAVVTGGASLGARAGLLSAEAERLALRSPAVLAGQEGKVVERLTSQNPAIRARQRLIHNTLNKLSPNMPVVGEFSRYARELDRLPRQVALKLRNSPEARAYNKSIRGLDNEEFVALHLIGRGLKPDDYAGFLRKQAEDHAATVEPAMFKVLENPRVKELVDHPDEKLNRAVDAATALSKLDASVKAERGLLDPATAEARIHKHAVDVYGEGAQGRFYVPDVPHASRVANADLAKMGGGVGVAKNPVKQNRSVLFRTGQLALHPDVLGPEFLKTLKYGLFDDIHSELMSSAVRVSHAELAAHGAPRGWVLLRKKIVVRESDRVGGQVNRLEGLLRAQHVPEYKKRVQGYPAERVQSKIERLKQEQAAAQRGPNKVVGVRSQQIHPLLSKKGQALREQEDILSPQEQIHRGFDAKDLADAETVHGDYLIVPERLTKHVAGEFTRSDTVIRQFLEKPTKVWRALVLGFRVGFLTNNLVGNHLLYAIHAAGIDGLRAYLNAVKRVKGEKVVRSLLADREIPEALRQKFMDEFFPEQSSSATFTATQHPVSEASGVGRLAKGKKRRRIANASKGLLPVTQAVAETTLRRGLVETYIRKSPEFRKVYRAMPANTRDFEAAAKRVLSGEGGHLFQRQISDKVNHALGDYLNLSPVERNTLRAVMPFYSWYRAIATITAHLALDTPGRALILARLGEVGKEATQNALGDVPDYLQGLLPLGGHDGKERVLSTGGLNPFATIPQELQGVGGLLAGKPGATGRAFSQLGPNPLILGLIENLAGKNLFTGGELKPGPVPGVIGQTVAGVGTQLPLAQIAAAASGHGRESKLYGKQDLREALLQFLGAPVKSLDAGSVR
jgi:hypothetical protein